MTQPPIYQSQIYQASVYQPQTIYQPQLPTIYQPQPQVIYQPQQIQTPPQNPAQMTSENSRPRITQNWRSVMVVHQPISSSSYQPTGLHLWNSGTSSTQNPNSQHYLSLLITPKDVTSNNPEPNQPATFTNNISPAIITDDESLAIIFPFKLEEITTVPLFSGAAIEKKPIMAMYTDAKVDSHRVDRAVSTRIITADGATKTSIGEIDDFPFEVNGIIVSIKVLVIEATQYQALVGNDWLTKTNAILDWTTQKLQLSQNGQHTQVPVICDHFKLNHMPAPLINLEKEKPKLIWEAYQVSWTDVDHNKLPPILAWNDNDQEKGKGKKELIWNTDQAWEISNSQKDSSTWKWKKSNQEKGKGNEENQLKTNETTKASTSGWRKTYSTDTRPEPLHIPLKCKNCNKKLSLLRAWVAPDKDYWMHTHYYCKPCHHKHYRYPKRQGK
ncbi:hypothetical protein G9A89_006983 [Geosiphon pyriformis]|nr:hypothetical protein G9A89_006983 [Geosiphon pyriformis]